MKKTAAFIILFLLSAAPEALALPGPVCGQCGVFCDAAACEALGGAGKCFFTGEPPVSDPASCMPCSGIRECAGYRFAGAPEKIWTNLCTRDPCNKNCGVSPDLTACRSCQDIDASGDCDKYVAGSFQSERCCPAVANQPMAAADAQKIKTQTLEVTMRDAFWRADCFCGCGKNEKGEAIDICASGLYPRSSDDQDPDIIDTAKEYAAVACSKQCGKNCGQYATECNGKDGNCQKCCEGYCNDDNPKNQYGGASKDECITVCKRTCEYKKLWGDMTGFIYTLSGIVGAIMIIIQAFRLATSSDAHQRSEAKRSIAYVVLALVIIALAGAIVSLFTDISGAARPDPCKVPSVSGAVILFMLKRKDY